jgi:hypothetical protein
MLSKPEINMAVHKWIRDPVFQLGYRVEVIKTISRQIELGL